MTLDCKSNIMAYYGKSYFGLLCLWYMLFLKKFKSSYRVCYRGLVFLQFAPPNQPPLKCPTTFSPDKLIWLCYQRMTFGKLEITSRMRPLMKLL